MHADVAQLEAALVRHIHAEVERLKRAALEDRIIIISDTRRAEQSRSLSRHAGAAVAGVAV